MRDTLETENQLPRVISRLSDLVLLSLCWLLCCIPVVTIGASCIALYDAVARCVRGEEEGACRRFFRTFKKELGRGILITLLWLLAGGILGISCLILTQQNATMGMLYLCSLFIPLAVLCWVIPAESRFTYSFAQLHRAAVLFAFGNPGKTIVIAALLAAAVLLLLNVPVLCFLLPSLLVYAQSYFIESVFARYMSEEA